ncbi:uncharacterized protein LOC106436528 [Brassica napus]|uniref:uncharacterized protein LOC106436528 n=1 Tax=Brassica napus TaxID=3708 RepID=UPI0006AB2416|nr:uncharacterized protein LOC106436528 [Brassica napus]
MGRARSFIKRNYGRLASLWRLGSSVKDHRRQAITSKKWPSKPENDPPITFSPDDAIGVHLPHNDPLLVEVGIAKCDVAKVLVDTDSSVDLIIRDTLDKMGVDLRDMNPSSRSLTGFNVASEMMIGTIKLRSTHAGTPWLHSIKAISLTYHQCVKFPRQSGQVQTLQGDQQAARDLLITTVKLRQSTPRINAIAKQIQSQKDEILVVTIDESDQSKVVRVYAFLSEEMQRAIIDFLKQNASTFAWTTSDMKGINPAITSHVLNVDPNIKPIRQKRRKLGPERSKAINEEVERLLAAGSITEVRCLEWLANPVVVKKKNGKWRVCVDFTDLNKACPKDSYLLPQIDRLVESTAGNELLTFMDAFSGYNQIMMYPDDREKTAFITDRGTYCNKVMPFGLKNACATYQ